MKKLFSTLFAVLSFSLLMAQSVTVPSGVQVAFKNKYKSTSATWSETNQAYVVKWTNGDKKMTAVYVKDETGTLLRTETDVEMSELSSATQTSLKERFMSEGSVYTLVRTFKVEGLTGVVEGAEFNMNNGQNTKLSIFFDAEGQLAKREVN